MYLVQKARRENPELRADQVSKDQRERKDILEDQVPRGHPVRFSMLLMGENLLDLLHRILDLAIKDR